VRETVDIKNVTIAPKMFGTSPSETGRFDAWRFPLMFDSLTFYWRRFGVDMPSKCQPGQSAAPCPILVDFHGSFDSLYSQRAWTKWYKYQKQPEANFILLTPEGSPDALTTGKILNDCNTTGTECISSSATSWDVLGWGNVMNPIHSGQSCDPQPGAPVSQCFSSTPKPVKAYTCFGTQMDKDPTVCEYHHDDDYYYDDSPPIPHKCMCASGANDWDYVAQVLRFVVDYYTGDATRIYFTGQSMGGMAAVQFAVSEGKWALPPEVRPAAIVPSAASAARSFYANLNGTVPTLLMWGYADNTAPPTIWSGYQRFSSNTSKPLSKGGLSDMFSDLIAAEQLKEKALAITGGMPHAMCSEDVCTSQLCCLLLQANVMSGGDLLANSRVQQMLMEQEQLGCKNDLGYLTATCSYGFMWEGINATLHGILGYGVDMSKLSFKPPPSVPQDAQQAIDFLCADVPNRNGDAMNASRQSVPVRVCVYNGGHSLPWNGKPSGHGSDWSAISGNHGRVFHDFVWKDFLQSGGMVRRE
jgi:dienelactone hydrolase